MPEPTNNLREFCNRSLARDVPPELVVMANFLRGKHKNAFAILAYGSCLRGVAVSDTLMDFYVLMENLGGVSSNPVSRLACAVVPPNVYYAETGIGEKAIRAKYAVLPLAQFVRWMARGTDNPYFWARFSQPSALVHVYNELARQQVIDAIAEALKTSFANARSLTLTQDPLAIWSAGFEATYKSELRSEKTSRAADIVAASAEYYKEAAQLLASEIPIHANQTLRKATGKFWSVLRLIKATFTFQGGADYIVWKIERHSGKKIVLSPWQRKHPVIAGLLLLPSLLRKGAVR